MATFGRCVGIYNRVLTWPKVHKRVEYATYYVSAASSQGIGYIHLLIKTSSTDSGKKTLEAKCACDPTKKCCYIRSKTRTKIAIQILLKDLPAIPDGRSILMATGRHNY